MAQARHNQLLKVDHLGDVRCLQVLCDSLQQVSVDLETSHHLLLLWQLSHELGHIRQGHTRRVCLRSVDDALDLVVDVLESLKEVHVAEQDPQFILIVQNHHLILYFDRAIGFDAIFDIHHVCLVEKVVGNRRDQVKCPIQYEKTTSRLLNPRLVLRCLIKLFELLVEDRGEHATELGLSLVLNIGIFHVNGAHGEEATGQLVDQGHQHFIF